MEVLYLVVLGGKVANSHIEVHDVRWVCGNSIEETIPLLKKEWIGSQKGLHIDSFTAIRYIDGYKVSIRRKESICLEDKSNESINEIDKNKESLWFVNLGGYDSSKLHEEHAFQILVANNHLTARKLAKKREGNIFKEKMHCDNIYSIKYVRSPKDHNINANQESTCIVELTADPQKRSQKLTPDWYGYWRIDNFKG